MASSRELKNRIRATKNIRQMTRAMEAVSAVKMRRSTELALQARPYALTALQVLRDIRTGVQRDTDPTSLSPLFEERAVETVCLVVVTADKGLAGAFNTSVIRAAEKYIKKSGKRVRIVAVGKKGRDYFARRGYNVAGEFLGVGDFGAVADTEPITDILRDEFESGRSDSVVLVYTNFLSALKQTVIERHLLPFTEATLEEIVAGIVPLRGTYANIPSTFRESEEGVLDPEHNKEFALEPTEDRVLSRVLPQLLKIQVYHAILEANASEHSSRMMAMKSASENAGELIDDLTLQFNKARQAAITTELSEITAGKEALEG